jgi:hypothetical protein
VGVGNARWCELECIRVAVRPQHRPNGLGLGTLHKQLVQEAKSRQLDHLCNNNNNETATAPKGVGHVSICVLNKKEVKKK